MNMLNQTEMSSSSTLSPDLRSLNNKIDKVQEVMKENIQEAIKNTDQ